MATHTEPIGPPRECQEEFGAHTDHSDCARMLDVMANGYESPYDYYDNDPMGYDSDSYIAYLNG